MAPNYYSETTTSSSNGPTDYYAYETTKPLQVIVEKTASTRSNASAFSSGYSLGYEDGFEEGSEEGRLDLLRKARGKRPRLRRVQSSKLHFKIPTYGTPPLLFRLVNKLSHGRLEELLEGIDTHLLNALDDVFGTEQTKTQYDIIRARMLLDNIYRLGR